MIVTLGHFCTEGRELLDRFRGATLRAFGCMVRGVSGQVFELGAALAATILVDRHMTVPVGCRPAGAICVDFGGTVPLDYAQYKRGLCRLVYALLDAGSATC